MKWLINNGKFTYTHFDQIQHLNARVKLSLALTLGKEKRYNHQLSRALASKGAKRGQKGCLLFVRVG